MDVKRRRNSGGIAARFNPYLYCACGNVRIGAECCGIERHTLPMRRVAFGSTHQGCAIAMNIGPCRT